MSRAGILLRVLLSISLVLNSIGGTWAGAMAMAAVPDGSTARTASIDIAPATAQSSCHDHEPVTPEQQSPPAADPAPKTPAGHADCCGGGLCGCACVQLSSLAAIELLFVPPSLDHEHLSDAVAPTRPSPALPHLIRPPIA